MLPRHCHKKCGNARQPKHRRISVRSQPESRRWRPPSNACWSGCGWTPSTPRSCRRVMPLRRADRDSAARPVGASLVGNQGREAVGLAQMHEGLTAQLAGETKVAWPVYLALLAEVYGQVGQVDEGQRLLAEVYGWFTEGFDTVDLQEAHALLKAWVL